MQKIIFPQSGIFHLQKLAHQIYATTGIRHRLSNETSMLNLIKHSANSNNQLTRQYFKDFTNAAGEETITKLSRMGVINV